MNPLQKEQIKADKNFLENKVILLTRNLKL